MILLNCDHVFALLTEDFERLVEDRSQRGKDWAATNTAAFVVLDLWLRDARSIAAHDAFRHVTAFHAAFGYPLSMRHARSMGSRFRCHCGNRVYDRLLRYSAHNAGKKTA